MRRIIPLACFVFLVVLSGSVSAVTNVTGCGTLSTPGETYVLSNDIIKSTSGTCITIGADNITFDGNGHTITGNEVVYSGTGYHGVYLFERTGITIKNLNINHFTAGIRLHSSNDNTITDNTVSGNSGGISLYSAHNNILTNNLANSNRYWGLSIGGSRNNTVANNIVNSNNGKGIIFSYSRNNTLTNNIVSNHNYGIIIYSSGDYAIYNNLFNNTANFGSIYTNNDWNTTKQAGTNIVGGPYLGGNFWAKPDGTGFSDTCTDADRDGICDSNYTLAYGDVDYLPLSLNFAVDTHPPAQRRHRHFGNIDNVEGNVDGNVGNYDNGGNVGNFEGNVEGNTDTGTTTTNEDLLTRLWQWMRGSGR